MNEQASPDELEELIGSAAGGVQERVRLVYAVLGSVFVLPSAVPHEFPVGCSFRDVSTGEAPEPFNLHPGRMSCSRGTCGAIPIDHCGRRPCSGPQSGDGLGRGRSQRCCRIRS